MKKIFYFIFPLLAALLLPLQAAAAEGEVPAALPQISAQPLSASVCPGESCTLSVTAASPDGGQLSYLWYSASQPDMNSMTAINRGSETGSSLAADTSVPGTLWYCVLVTNTLGAQSTSLYSQMVSVTVSAAGDSLEILSEPGRRSYFVGESPDGSGLTLRLHRGGSSEDISAGFTLEPQSFTAPGEQLLTVSFDGLSAALPVIVYPREALTPVISAQPRSISLKAGESGSLSLSAQSLPEAKLSCSWYSGTGPDKSSMSPVPNAAGLSLSVTAGGSGRQWYYARVTASLYGLSASAESEAAAVTVQAEAPVIAEQPLDMTVEGGSECILRVRGSVKGSGSLSYLWYSSETPDMNSMTAINRGSETGSELIVDTREAGTRYYWVLVMNTDNGETASLYSRMATVTVRGAESSPGPSPSPAVTAVPSPSAPDILSEPPVREPLSSPPAATPRPVPPAPEAGGPETPPDEESPEPEPRRSPLPLILGGCALLLGGGAAVLWFRKKKF